MRGSVLAPEVVFTRHIRSSMKSVDCIQRALARNDGQEEMWDSKRMIGSFCSRRISVGKKIMMRNETLSCLVGACENVRRSSRSSMCVVVNLGSFLASVKILKEEGRHGSLVISI